jgi:hypothetical protein
MSPGASTRRARLVAWSRRRAAWILILLALVHTSCARPPRPVTLEVGRRTVRLVVPAGWEHLDHGRQQLFRLAEAQLSLTNRGPIALEAGTPAADSAAHVLELVLGNASDTRRRELAVQARDTIAGTAWSLVETWDHVTHLDRKRVAFTDAGGELLVLRVDRGDIARTGAVFDGLLRSLVLLPEPRPGQSAPGP